MLMRDFLRLRGGEPSGWRAPLLFGGLLLLLMTLSYPGVVLGWETFCVRDFGLFGYPLAYHYRQSVWSGELPLWNPLSNCGIPFLAQWNALVLYPGSVFYLVLPLAWGLPMFCLLHQVLAGVGMFLLARRLTQDDRAAAVGGVAFAFSGLMQASLIWPSIVAGVAWMPWLILACLRLFERGVRALWPAALAGAMQMLTGAPELILFTWVLALGFLGVALRRAGQRWGRRVGLMGLFAALVLLVAALAAAQLGPFFELVAASHRQGDFADGRWAMPGTGWANLLVPLFGCARGPDGIFFQPDQSWALSYYLGIATVVWALVAATRVRRAEVGLLAAATLASLVLALGEHSHAQRWIRAVVPALTWMTFPVKFVFIAGFCVPLLAAYAVARTTPSSRAPSATAPGGGPADPISFRPICGWTLAALGMVGLLLWFGHAFPGPGTLWPEVWRNGLARALFLVGTMAVWHAALLPRLSSSMRRLCWLGVLALLWLDLQTHAPCVNPPVARKAVEPNIVQFALKPELGKSRLMNSAEARQGLAFENIADPLNRFWTKRLGLTQNCNLIETLPKVDGFYPLYLHHPFELVSRLYAQGGPFPAPLLDFLGVSHINARGQIFEWARRDSFLPLLTAGQAPVFANAAETFESIFSTNWNPRATVYLPPQAKANVQARGEGSVRVIPGAIGAHALRCEVEAAQPAMVVVAQAYYHNWRAYVDDQPVPLWRANDAFQALQVPPGRHRVQLTYEDRAFRVGTAVSLVALAACALGCWFSRRRSSPGGNRGPSWAGADRIPPSLESTARGNQLDS